MLKMKVSINLDNEAMRTSYDVASALQVIGEDLIDVWMLEYGEVLTRIVNQTIFDRYGNDVGRWAIIDVPTEVS